MIKKKVPLISYLKINYIAVFTFILIICTFQYTTSEAKEDNFSPITAEDNFETLNIVKAEKSGRAKFEASGAGLSNVLIKAVRLSENGINVKIPAGTYFKNRGTAQNMVSTSPVSIYLLHHQKAEVTVPAACANAYKSVPDHSSKFDIIAAPPSEDLRKLMKVIGKEHPLEVIAQTAVWIVTDDITRKKLNKRLALKSINQPFDSYAAVSETGVKEAINLVEKAIYPTGELKQNILTWKFSIKRSIKSKILLTKKYRVPEEDDSIAVAHLSKILRIGVGLSEEFMSGAVVALGRYGKEGNIQALETLIFSMKNRVPLVRQKAAEALGEIGDCKALNPLISSLKDKNLEVRKAAVSALGSIGDKIATKPLIRALKNKNYEIRWRAVDALEKIGDPSALKSILKALNDKNAIVRQKASRALWTFGDSHLIKPLIEALNDTNYEVRFNSVVALERIGDSTALIPFLLKMLQNKKDYTRIWAAEALISLGDTSATDSLIKALKDNNKNVRWRAAAALANIGDKKAIDPLIDVLKNDESVYPWILIEAFKRIGKSSVPSLLKALKDTSSTVRCRVAKALGEVGDARSVELLLNSLDDKEPKVREHAALALGKIGDDRAIGPLLQGIKDKNSGYRFTATKALLMIGPSAFPHFISLLRDYNRELAKSTEESLYRGTSEDNLKIIIETLKYAKKKRDSWLSYAAHISTVFMPNSKYPKHFYEMLSDRMWNFQEILEKVLEITNDKTKSINILISYLSNEKTYMKVTAIRTLAHIGDNRALKPLMALLDDENWVIRREAASALGMIGNKKSNEALTTLARNDVVVFVRQASRKALQMINKFEHR
ncbi:MAG: hypothetical protein GTO45_40555 [Candidatus Aminicenantes bacterium]|nr:hypothetical protein [Candidatus Aminicenantes bacterium]NIM84898.1 hypothetical protein [Candidatus Aminicenantes bacterium]NIN24409.1 hypothetical protein [Candidatus Aminicenantes bacterium]NIN48173.1 hypothetical protein [Candidatus Aminicenantes bacterium]NIN91076.1 hypothetical protein [Candidatus Aminicenantes bacterium]